MRLVYLVRVDLKYDVRAEGGRIVPVHPQAPRLVQVKREPNEGAYDIYCVCRLLVEVTESVQREVSQRFVELVPVEYSLLE